MFIKSSTYFTAALFYLLSNGSFHAADALDRVDQYQVYEIELAADQIIENPFDVYLLKLAVESPSGRKIFHDGFFDGNGAGGRKGRSWKARICPDEPGVWKWKAIPGDRGDTGLAGRKGRFMCVESTDPGGIVRDGKFFRFQRGGPIFLQGNFLDFAGGLPSTHVFMSEMISDADRTAILKRQRDFHQANKINVYFANKGDYGGVSTTPWMKTESGYDFTRMDTVAWTRFDRHIEDIENAGMLAELWFFADDSGFGRLSQADKNRLYRYAMARVSAFAHTMFVIALEWQEEWSIESIRASGRFIQRHNPWGRLLSVHSLPAKSPDSIRSFLAGIYKEIFKGIRYSDERWISFIASQAGNDATPEQVNALAVDINRTETIPHLSEEFGILKKENDPRLTSNMWANFCGGAAGAGTGSNISALMRFLESSRIPFQRMNPMNALLDNGGKTAFCLAEIGHHYLVYSQKGGFRLEVEGQGLTGYWYKPTDPCADLQKPFAVRPGAGWYDPPSPVGDWVLWVTDESNLTDGRLHPPKRHTMVKAKEADRENDEQRVSL